MKPPRATIPLILLAAILPFIAQTSQPAGPDLSTPKAAILSLYAALRAGDIPAAKSCLQFAGPAQADTFDITATQLWAPLKLMHALETRFGEAARQPFACASLEKNIDKALEDIERAQITENQGTAVIAEKKAATDPAAETEITGITLKHVGDRWLVVADTFPDITAEIPAAQLPMMRALANAVAQACQTTLDRLAKGDFKSVDEAFAAYQTAQQQASKTPPLPNPAPTK